jgi:hypothetical protein
MIYFISMKKNLVLILSFPLFLFGQVPPEKVSDNKSYYEELEPFNSSGINYNVVSGSTAMENTVGWLLMGYLNMYETTGDKAYLVKFINMTIECMLVRQDVTGGNFGSTAPFPPKWTLTGDAGGESTYYNTLLIFPMAKFIYIVKNNSELYNSNLNSSIVHLGKLFAPPSPFPFTSILGYGDFANWLRARVEETFSYLSSYYWDNTYGHIKKQLDHSSVAELNFQSLFASTSMYLYKINVGFGSSGLSTSMLYDQLNLLKSLYLGDHEPICFGPYIPIFEPQSNGSFHWYHYGWRQNPPDCEFYKEDLAHGAMDLFFPMEDWKTGANFFSTINFHNWVHQTFTKNIYESPYKFYNTVWKTDDGYTSGGLKDCDGVLHSPDQLNAFYLELLNWMPLEQFDDPSNSVYEALILHAYNLKTDAFHSFLSDPCTNTHYAVGGQSLLGLSEVIKAQWRRECVDLNMTNRDLIYDQDFYARGSIYIQPTYTSTSTVKAFAEPNNTTTPGAPDYFNKNEYIVESGVKCHMKAGKGIHLYPGFSAKAGCDFRAYIDPSICDGGASLPFHSPIVVNDVSINPVQETSLNTVVEAASLVNLVANVDADKELVWLQSQNTQDENQSLIITDLTGRVLRTYDHLPSSVNTNDLPTACYIFCYTTINGRASQKVFLY